MRNYIQKSVVVDATSEKSDFWDFDILVKDRLPKVKSVICLNDLSSLRNKIFLTLTHNSERIDFLDEIDCHRLTDAYEEPVSIDYTGARFNYTVKNNDSSSKTLYFLFELEYPL